MVQDTNNKQIRSKACRILKVLFKSSVIEATVLEEKFVNLKYVTKGTIESRDYQTNLAKHAITENCIVVLPTGLGKTAVALQVIAKYLEKGTGAILFLAPTRVLVNQHYEFLQKNMTIDDIALVTGEDTIKKRKGIWNTNSVLCATPEIARNDLDRGIVLPDQFSLIIFDEVHRTVGNYAYSSIANRVEEVAPRILGMTATLPSEKTKATEIITRLHISKVAERTEDSPDVKPYIQRTEMEWVYVQLPAMLVQIQKFLKAALNQRYQILKDNKVGLNGQQSLSALLRVRQYVLQQDRRSAKPLFTAIRIHYALNILETHGVTPFLKFCERASKKGGIGVKELLEWDSNFTNAIRLAREATSIGIEHPKIPKLIEIINRINNNSGSDGDNSSYNSSGSGKALIFTSYRDSVDLIHAKLKENGIPSGILIGKAGQTGFNQKKQIEAVRKFRDGEFRVLVATRVGEEGLDIAEVNHVIFYDNVPSSIRFVQRRGRTGRKDAGKLVALIAKGTIDETYYWIGRRKMTVAKTMGRVMSTQLSDEKANMDAKNELAKKKDGLDAFL